MVVCSIRSSQPRALQLLVMKLVAFFPCSPSRLERAIGVISARRGRRTRAPAQQSPLSLAPESPTMTRVAVLEHPIIEIAFVVFLLPMLASISLRLPLV